MPRSRCVSPVWTPCRAQAPTGSPSAAIPAPAQGERVTRCPHGAIPALNNSWHCWPQASCPEEEEWLWRGRQSERENHHDLGTSSVLCHLLPGTICPRDPGPAGGWGCRGPCPESPPHAPCHSPKWG